MANPSNRGPIKVAIVGIDGSGKSTVIREIKEKLGKKYKIGHVTLLPRPADHKGSFRKIMIALQALSRKSDRTKDKIYLLTAQLAHVGIYPAKRLAVGRNKDVILYERHPAIDYDVYKGIYLGSAKRAASLLKRLSVSGAPDVIIYTECSPEVAYKRITKRASDAIKLGKEGFIIEDGIPVRIKKHMHLHESSVELLAATKRKFDRIIADFEKKGMRVIRYNSEGNRKRELAKVIRELDEAIFSFLSSSLSRTLGRRRQNRRRP